MGVGKGADLGFLSSEAGWQPGCLRRRKSKCLPCVKSHAQLQPPVGMQLNRQHLGHHGLGGPVTGDLSLCTRCKIPLAPKLQTGFTAVLLTCLLRTCSEPPPCHTGCPEKCFCIPGNTSLCSCVSCAKLWLAGAISLRKSSRRGLKL